MSAFRLHGQHTVDADFQSDCNESAPPSTGADIESGCAAKARLGVKDYALRLVGDEGRTVDVLRFTRPCDQSAKEVILTVREPPYARYELWRGMEMIAQGKRFVIAN